jgi:UDP-N-acetylmuramoyl-L-alanyl-D-glutamate--2,6-diaminopimelate ligase
MRLHDLTTALQGATLNGNGDIDIRSLEYDSRQVEPGALFVAVRGLQTDGRNYIPQAVAAGASAVMADLALEDDPGVPVLTVPDVRSGMSLAAAELYGHPSQHMALVGITGTNGKTTTTYLLESILQQAGLNCGIIGTVNARYDGNVYPARLTTPEGPDLQRLLSEMLSAGVSHTVMEVASHALALHRVAGCRFDIGVFTNLSQDHLDYHKNMESYFQAKATLFTHYLTGNLLSGGPRAVINIDDEYGQRLADMMGRKALTVSLTGPADLTARHIETGRVGLSATIQTPRGEFDVHTRILGGLNLYNFLSAAGTALLLGLDYQRIITGLETVSGVPGRLERVGTNDDFLVLVDYAHTPDALERVLEAARALGPRRLITVFGCGGDRDRTKRPVMGRAAGSLSDLAIITSDNPRTEDPLAIIADIETGLSDLQLENSAPQNVSADFKIGTYTVVPDRREAIRLACGVMKPGDMLVVAGKGHEDYQILGARRIHFDDREEARDALTRENKF